MDPFIISEEDYRIKLEGYNWNQLRKEAKHVGIPAKGTREVLLVKLMQHHLETSLGIKNDESGLENNNVIKSEVVKEQITVPRIDNTVTENAYKEQTEISEVAKETFQRDEEDADVLNYTTRPYSIERPESVASNATFTVSKEDDQSNATFTNEPLDENMEADVERMNVSSETITVAIDESETRRDSTATYTVANIDDEEMDQAQEAVLEFEFSENIGNAPKLSNTSVKPGSNEKQGRWFEHSPIKRGELTERFARIHNNLFNAMPSLETEKNKVAQRHQDHQSNASERILRLATPKKVHRCSRFERKEGTYTEFNPGLNPPPDPKALDFKFGNVAVEDIAKVQKPVNASDVTGTSRIPIRKENLRVDVKSRTMSEAKAKSRQIKRIVIPATVPEMTPRLEILATPRRLAPNSGRVSTPFKPFRGKYEYVDTTKMSDAEFAAYKARSQTPRR